MGTVIANDFIPQHVTEDDSKQSQLNASSYKALSYTWGDGSLTHSITINGALLKITRSLFDALSHLQPTSYPLRIWIDQICMNQRDSKEKEEQVSHMDRIYRNSEETLVWLGSAAEGSDGLFDIITRVGSFAETHGMLAFWSGGRRDEFLAIANKRDPSDAMTKKYHAFCEAVAQYFKRENFDAIESLCKRPWFSRAWVVQEFALPPRVTFVCGEKRVRAEILMMGMQILESTIYPLVLTLYGKDLQIGWRWLVIARLVCSMRSFLRARANKTTRRVP